MMILVGANAILRLGGVAATGALARTVQDADSYLITIRTGFKNPYVHEFGYYNNKPVS
jgi:hypothetical protein